MGGRVTPASLQESEKRFFSNFGWSSPGGRHFKVSIMTAKSRKGYLSTVSIRVDVPKTMDRLTQKIIAYNIKFTGCAEKQIKAAPRAMAEKLVRFYKHLFRDWQLERMGMIEGLEPPTLLMNNMILAKEMTTTDRTIRNYKKRLMGLGFIEKSVYHGSKKPYELVLNMDFFVFQKRHRDGIWCDNVQIFPPKGSGTSFQDPSRTLLAENSTKGKELDPGQRKIVPEQQPEPIDQDEMGSTQADRIHQKSALFFSQTRQCFWLDQYFSQNDCNLARKHLAEIFRRKPDRLDFMFKVAFTRTFLAFHYWQREFGENLPPPHLFFDPNNPKGISATKTWLGDQERFPIQAIKTTDKFRLQTHTMAREKNTVKISSIFNR